MRYPIWLLLVCAGCAARVAPTAGTAPALAAVRPEVSDAPRAEAPPAPAPTPAPAVESPAPVATAPASAPEGSCPLSAEDAEGEDDDAAEVADGEAGGDAGDDGESPEAVASGEVPTGPVYSADISDEDLARRWKNEIGTLGSMAVGFVQSGRLVNGKRFPNGPEWIVVSPEVAWATEETIDYLTTAIREVRAKYPEAPPLRVNGISNKEGGYLRPHKSHQNGRDVDVGFYYPTVDPIREREREKYINVPLNWALLRALITKTDVQMVLVDKRVRQVIYNYALSIGEDKAWLDSLFNDGPNGVIRHARRHRDHFHVRFHNPRAQELGRRVQPLLALQPEYNVTTHKIRNGDTLGGIALKYNSTIAMIKKANRMRNNFLRAGQRLSVPLRGPCTHCPVPPPFLLPPRRLPPEALTSPALVAAKAQAALDCKTAAVAAEKAAVPAAAGSAGVNAAAAAVAASAEKTAAPAVAAQAGENAASSEKVVVPAVAAPAVDNAVQPAAAVVASPADVKAATPAVAKTAEGTSTDATAAKTSETAASAPAVKAAAAATVSAPAVGTGAAEGASVGISHGR
ncbi:penicillin-insensitive murein endopeptidase [Pyxidicoccus parkwayensis]|uniref:Penicillin-insensitive murein endopeptidase n=1 Tax=Pyxidicoccus parkwayensis TaxID=2813578 RepID=A0ABX7NJ59_9BACT|nr:penicillin-insensitive murein endopeptidase [Pyxidicoccus parkwaysis]QSQ18881.1 penicillin-insensitive murein endopeptidase [Pyxidicoccus parkwaysis]